jgi:hypothetical protein
VLLHQLPVHQLLLLLLVLLALAGNCWWRCPTPQQQQMCPAARIAGNLEAACNKQRVTYITSGVARSPHPVERRCTPSNAARSLHFCLETHACLQLQAVLKKASALGV